MTNRDPTQVVKQGERLEQWYEVDIEVYEGSRSFVRIPVRVVERHLTPDTTQARVMGCGASVRLAIPSERDSLLLDLPTEEWLEAPPRDIKLHYEQSGSAVNRLYIGQFLDDLAIDRSGDEPTIPATAVVHDYAVL